MTSSTPQPPLRLTWPKIAAIAALVAMLGVGTYSVINAPYKRALKNDGARITDIVRIFAAAREIYKKERAVPPNLEAIAQKADRPLAITDPETRQPYEYRVAGPTTIEVCVFYQATAETRELFPDGPQRSCMDTDLARE